MLREFLSEIFSNQIDLAINRRYNFDNYYFLFNFIDKKIYYNVMIFFLI